MIYQPFSKGFTPILTAYRLCQQFVPPHKSITDSDILKFCLFLEKNKQCLVLTGAGISTESGIPDYRSEGVGLYVSSKSRPVIFRDFVTSTEIRRRYWARNFNGWPKFSCKEPNITHLALKVLEECGITAYTVTQNVDSLHTKAGSRNVVELHGSAYKVVCLSCDYIVERHAFQEELMSLNSVAMVADKTVNPDGDVSLPEGYNQDFIVPQCPQCSGILKPDIVFFGDNVPPERIKRIKEIVQNSNSLIVLGSSLAVYSSYRIILQASELKKPVLIVNIGPTRGDDLADIKLNVRCGEVFERVLELIKS